MFSLIIIIYTAVDCCTLILAELGTILFYLKKKKKILIFFYRFAFAFDSSAFALAFAFDSNAFDWNQMRNKFESNAKQMRIKLDCVNAT